MNEYHFMGDVDEATILEHSRKLVAKDMKCHRVGKIIAFNSDDLTCTVRLFDKLTSYGTEENYVDFPDLPLLIQGTDTKHITFGDIVGSECIIHYNDTDIDNWFETGEIYLPNSARRHSFSDGFVELRPFNKTAVFTYYTGGIEIKNGNTVIHINDDNSITIEGADVTITGNLTVSGTITGQTDVIADTISGKSHVHGGVRHGTDNSGTPI